MLNKDGTISISEIGGVCFYVFWTVLLIGKGLGYTGTDNIFRYMTLAVIPFAIIKLAVSEWTQKEFLICVCLNLLGIMVWFFSHDASILLTIIAITSCKEIDLYKLFKFTFWIKGIMFVAVTSLAILGVTDIQYSPRYYSSTVYDVRYALGYQQSNATHYTLFIVVVLALMVYHKKMRLYHYMALWAYNFFIFHYTDSRTGMLMSTFVLLMTYIADRRSGVLLKKLVRCSGKFVYIIGAIGSIVICYLFAKLPILRSFGTLSSRFATATQLMTNTSLSLFGKPDIVTDFGYIAILYGGGMIVFFLFLIAVTNLMQKCAKKNMYIEMIVLIAYSIYTLSEAYTSSILMNVSLILLTWIIYPRNEGKMLGSYFVNSVGEKI